MASEFDPGAKRRLGGLCLKVGTGGMAAGARQVLRTGSMLRPIGSLWSYGVGTGARGSQQELELRSRWRLF